jgi:hypothetical protein
MAGRVTPWRSTSQPVDLSATDGNGLGGVNGATHHVHQFDSADRLLLEEEVDDGIEGYTAFREDHARPLSGRGEDAADLLVGVPRIGRQPDHGDPLAGTVVGKDISTGRRS